MTFSVIVPCYNIEGFVVQCVESILTQTYKDFELILVDDGSIDATAEILNEYKAKDARVTVIHKANGGLTSARKAGAAVARGAYIVCVDGDDWVKEDQLAQYSAIIDQYHPDVICCGYDRVSENGLIQKCHPSAINGQYGIFDRAAIEAYLLPNLFSFPPSVWSKVFRKDLYIPVQMSLDDRICMGEDGAISYICLTRANSVYLHDESLYNYRSNPLSMTGSVKKSIPWDGVALRIRRFETMLPVDRYDFRQQLSDYAAHAIMNAAIACFAAEKYRDAKKRVMDALKPENHRNYVRTAIKSKDRRVRLAACVLNWKLFPLIKLRTLLQ